LATRFAVPNAFIATVSKVAVKAATWAAVAPSDGAATPEGYSGTSIVDVVVQSGAVVQNAWNGGEGLVDNAPTTVSNTPQDQFVISLVDADTGALIDVTSSSTLPGWFTALPGPETDVVPSA
jgi:hypothetical protein